MPTTPQKRADLSPPAALSTAGAVFSLLSISLVIFTYERALVPLYGSGPTNFLLNKIVLATIFAAAIHPIKLATWRIWLCTALGLSCAPNATYWVAVHTSRGKDPIMGPAITHLAVLTPLVFFLMSSVVEADVSEIHHQDTFSLKIWSAYTFT